MKKISKYIFSIWMILCFVVLSPKAHADGIEIAGRSWDEIIEEYLASCNAQEGNVTIGYYNTVTGEEHFYDPDRYMVTASMYKVPLTMIFAERAAAGEIDLEDTVGAFRYSVLMEGAIIDSNNNYAETLWRSLGSYREYRRIIAPYMGEDADEVDAKYYENNFFTARQMLTCLKTLYNDQESFGYVIDLMKRAEPHEYFRRHENRYEIAHKFGYLPDDSIPILYLNDCGIIYTDDPYLLVCFTAGAEKPYGLISNLVTLMSDYTQYQRQERIAAEEAAEAERLRAEMEAALREEQDRSDSEQNDDTPGDAEKPEKAEISRLAVMAVLFVLSLALTVLAELRNGGIRFGRLFAAFICLLFCFALWFCFISP